MDSDDVPNISRHRLIILVWSLDDVPNISRHRLIILVWTLTIYRILATVSLPAYEVSHSKPVKCEVYVHDFNVIGKREEGQNLLDNNFVLKSHKSQLH